MISSRRLLNASLELVQTNSETGNEGTMQPALKKEFVDLGLNIIEDSASKREWLGADNLIYTLPNDEGEEHVSRIYFTSHMGTVVPGINVKPILKEDGYVCSDDVTVLGVDGKAGITALLEMIQTINEQELPYGQIQFIITVGEEAGLKGAKELDQNLIDTEFGYAVDASQAVGATVAGAPTQVIINTTIYGKTAHVSKPNQGISAIYIATKTINKMHLGQADQDTTANIGRFYGGSATNIVTDKVISEGEAHSCSDKSLEYQVNHMREAFEATTKELGGKTSVEISESYPGFRRNDSETVTRYTIKSTKALDLSGETVIAGGGSGGGIINTYHIPTVILGVRYEHIHATSERIPVAALNQFTSQLIKIAELVMK